MSGPITLGLPILVFAITTFGHTGELVDVDDTWNLTDLYSDDDSVDAARRGLAARLPDLEKLRGTLGQSSQAMRQALTLYSETLKEYGRISSFASMRSDEDTRVPTALAAKQEVQQLGTELSTATSWVAPEILALPDGTVARFLADDPGLAPYRFFLQDLERQRAHTLSPAEERILSSAGMIGSAPSTFYTVLANAELPFPEATLSDGKTVHLDQSGYSKYRGVAVREDRKLVFDRFWKVFSSYERTLGVALDAQVRRDVFFARSRNYPSALAAALDGNNVPMDVYTTLIAEANRALPTLHRIFRLRGRMLGVEDQKYFDVYPSVVPELDREYPIAEGKRLVVEAVAPLGAEYVKIVGEGFRSRWMDVYPRPGKRSGAYSNGAAYDVHPYVLMNYNDDYDSVSTLAHEWGHAMHSHLANRAQPFPTASYPIFIAEVASTFNEALLLDRMLDDAASDDERMFLLGSYLETIRGTYFRQAMFAEFELAIHAAVERGEALTGANLSQMYGELLRRYHGHDQGIVAIDDPYTVEWAYIPHFYYNFYVYQYATSLAASTLFADEVLLGKQGALESYLGLLEAGGSAYPYDLLKNAGVDLAAPAPYRALEAKANWAMDEIEKILDRRARP